MGPLITDDARNEVLRAQESLAKRGRLLLEATALDRQGYFLAPGVVEIDRFRLEEHESEIFGPFVQVARATDLDDAIAQANATKFGLAASVFTNDESEWREIFAQVRAGCINLNTGTAGASSKLPFGGLGASGNHRPAGAFAVDAAAYPVATMIDSAELTIAQGMCVDERFFV